MPGFGYGFGARSGSANTGRIVEKEAMQHVEPSIQWTGVVGSGFTAEPVDPARITAKPALRLITVPNQHFVDNTVIGVIALANDNGTLIGGIDRVRFHCEGEVIDVVEPGFYEMPDANGVSRTYWGYWAKLTKPENLSGTARVYVEAIPADATMQNRVIGPFSYFPADTIHDYEVEVAPSQTEEAGLRYPELYLALKYLKTVGANHPKVTITEPHPSGLYSLPLGAGADFNTYTSGAGWCEIVATIPVRLGYSAFTTDNAALFRPRYSGLHFSGDTITFDLLNVTALHDEGAGLPNWLDGVRITVSGAGRNHLWRAGQRPVSHIVNGHPYFTECDVSETTNTFMEALLVRGCRTIRAANDLYSDSLCVVYNFAHDLDSSEEFNDFRAAITITGPSNGTISQSSYADAPLRTFTVKESGAAIGTFNLRNKYTAYAAAIDPSNDPVASGTGYFVQDLADWINAIEGWSAIVVDNARRATALDHDRTNGRSFADVDVSGGLTLNTYFDQHIDWYSQNNNTSADENVIILGNINTAIAGQQFFITGTNGARDFMIVNNAIHVRDTGGTSSFFQSQLAETQSHIVVAHNVVPNRALSLREARNGGAIWNPDAYSLIANNAFSDIGYGGAHDTDVTMKNNAQNEGGVAPEGSIGHIVAGTADTKFADQANGDFSPIGPLIDPGNGRPPVMTIDAGMKKRGASAPVGAFTAALAASSA